MPPLLFCVHVLDFYLVEAIFPLTKESPMSVQLFGGYGVEHDYGSPIFVGEGDCLYRRSDYSNPVCTISGNMVFLGHCVSGTPLCTVIGDTVYATNGGGSPLFKIRGNQAFDGFGSGAPMITASSDDVMYIAAAAVMTRTRNDYRYASDARQAESAYPSTFSKNHDTLFGKPNDSDQSEEEQGSFSFSHQEPSNLDYRDPYENLNEIDRRIVEMYPWYINASENSIPPSRLPLMDYENLHPDDDANTIRRRHIVVGANYVNHGIVKPKWQMIEANPVFEYLPTADWTCYYDAVPYIYTHDEYMYGDEQEMKLLIMRAKKFRDEAERQAVENQVAVVKEAHRRQKEDHFYFDVQAKDFLTPISFFLIAVSYAAHEGPGAFVLIPLGAMVAFYTFFELVIDGVCEIRGHVGAQHIPTMNSCGRYYGKYNADVWEITMPNKKFFVLFHSIMCYLVIMVGLKGFLHLWVVIAVLVIAFLGLKPNRWMYHFFCLSICKRWSTNKKVVLFRW